VVVGDRPGLVYSGDCGIADDLRPLIRPGDTLLAEATYGADPVAPGSNHLNAHDLGRLAAGTGVERLLLTHLLMGRDRARAVAAAAAIASVPVEIVDPGDRFDL
jgi:ribonuclease BN (tRNA processing enzyme)